MECLRNPEFQTCIQNTQNRSPHLFLLELSILIKTPPPPRGIFKGERTIKFSPASRNVFLQYPDFLRRFFCIISLVHMYLPFHCTKIFVNQHLIPIQCIGNSELVGIYKRKINIRNK